MTIPPSLDLAGRVAVVSGAGSASGIGYATGVALRALGAHVVVTSTTDRIHQRVADLLDMPSIRDDQQVLGVVADLTVPTHVSALADAARQITGAIDVVVNNAGMTSVSSPQAGGGIDDVGLEEWDAVLARNASTAYAVIRACLPAMRAAGSGRIINVTSVTGPVMAMRHEVAYAAAKAAMVGMTRALAVDLAAEGITVNAVAPGWIHTGSATAHEDAQGLTTPMRRSGTPEEIASAIAWLASPGAAYVTGQVIVVDGGNSIAEERG